MNKELTCNQVSALISFYVKGKLNAKLKEYVDLHLEKCPSCRKKFNDLQKILNQYKKNPKTENEQGSNIINYDFQNRLSAYVDNELNIDENIKIKKMAITNPNMRRELESIYKYQKAMSDAYNKTKNDFKFDYARNIVYKLQEESEYSTTYFYKLVTIFVILITAIIGGFIYLYF